MNSEAYHIFLVFLVFSENTKNDIYSLILYLRFILACSLDSTQ